METNFAKYQQRERLLQNSLCDDFQLVEQQQEKQEDIHAPVRLSDSIMQDVWRSITCFSTASTDRLFSDGTTFGQMSTS